METKSTESPSLTCPVPSASSCITMAHGGGGRKMHDLIRDVFRAAESSGNLHDGAVLVCEDARLAITTDSFVVRPLVFPGGDIGKLAVCGTVNDLAMCGARPTAISAGFVIEEGFAIADLKRIAESMRDTARTCGVRIVTGDTKVVEKGHGDGLYINTTGIGWIKDGVDVSPSRIQPGDAIIVSGDLGRHGIALIAVREGLQFQSTVESDCAPLHAPILALLAGGVDVHCARDLTRGGLASALVEIAETRRLSMTIRESDIPVCDQVRAACEILGFDVLHIANEGRFCVFVPAEMAADAIQILGHHPVSSGAKIIGEVNRQSNGLVMIRTAIGTSRIVDMPSGELLPRIC